MDSEVILRAAMYLETLSSKMAVEEYFPHLIPFLEKQRERTVSELYDSLTLQGLQSVPSTIPFSISKQHSVQRRALAIFAPPKMYQFSHDKNTVRVQLVESDSDSRRSSTVWLHDGPEPLMILCSEKCKFKEWATPEGLVLFEVSRLNDSGDLEVVVGPRVTKEPFMPNYRNDSVSVSGAASTCGEATTPCESWHEGETGVDADRASDAFFSDD